ncbi:putative G-protein coupled receptor Mth-like 10 [Armadillidium vulgare]|nr:putative G-protein coupled receptor Mth-like 10 [Armadillidium vulgare]
MVVFKRASCNPSHNRFGLFSSSRLSLCFRRCSKVTKGRKEQARQRLKLCFKLFLVMGICWLTEIISAATSSSKWYIAEIFNCLQGFIIFLIFILKPKILHAVRERVCSLCCGQHQPRQQLRGRLTFTASVLSEFLSSTKRSHPPLSTHHLSTSSFSTSSPTLSWGSSLSASPATLQKPNKQKNYFYGRPNTASLKKDTNSNTRY